MKKMILSLIILSLIFSSCNKDEVTTKGNLYNATVIEQGLDCGNSYLVKFNEGLTGLPQNSFDNIFYEINLPQEYKVKDKQIYVEFRVPENDEIMVCTTFGISYPQIYITKVESKL